MALKKIYHPKHPVEVRKYGFNWSPKDIGTEVIVDIAADVIDGNCVAEIAVVGDVPNAIEGQGTHHVISGGIDGETCEVRLTATTDAVPPSVLVATVYHPIRG